MPTPSPALPDKHRERVRHWKAIVATHEQPHRWRAIWQLVNTLGSYLAAWLLIYWSLSVSYWLTVPLVLLASALLVRVFIIFHDCGHNSFFKSKRANQFWGFVTGLLTFTPYHHWKWEHDTHHSSAGNLERRGVGDIWTLTVEEYLGSSKWTKFLYRLARSPFILFTIAPLYVYLVRHRFALPTAKSRARTSVWIMNLAVLALAGALIVAFGFLPWLIIQVSVMGIAGTAGVWLFYVQHQFEDVYWEHGGDWDFTDAAIKGSSFYRLPKVLQWFSGNIGFHHVHHLSHRIPNYNLERCHKSDPIFSDVNPLSILESLKSLNFRLWDEASSRLISFSQLRKQRRALEN